MAGRGVFCAPDQSALGHANCRQEERDDLRLRVHQPQGGVGQLHRHLDRHPQLPHGRWCWRQQRVLHHLGRWHTRRQHRHPGWPHVQPQCQEPRLAGQELRPHGHGHGGPDRQVDRVWWPARRLHRPQSADPDAGHRRADRRLRLHRHAVQRPPGHFIQDQPDGHGLRQLCHRARHQRRRIGHGHEQRLRRPGDLQRQRRWRQARVVTEHRDRHQVEHSG